VSLAETGETVVVASSFNSNGGAYHTHDCRCVDQIESPKRVDKSVAEWKGLELCGYCGGEA